MTRERRPLLGLLALAAVLAFSVHVFSHNKADVDLWGNVGFVRALPGADAFLRTNTFSFTEPDHPWVNHEWLAEYVFFKVFERAGNTGLLALKLLFGLTLLAILYAGLRRDCRSGPVQLLYLLLIISTLGYGFGVRPHHFSYLLLALLLLFLKSPDRHRPWALCVAPLYGVLWANLHGAFFLFVVVGLVFACIELLRATAGAGDERAVHRRSAFVVLGACALFVAGTMVNPYGLHLWEFVFQSAGKVRPYLSEWGALHPVRHFSDHVDFMALALLTLAATVCSKRRKDPTWTILLAVAFAAAVFMRRNIPLFAMVAAFAGATHVESVAAEPLGRLAGRVPKRVAQAALALFAALCLFFAASFDKVAPLQIEIPRGKYPLRAVRLLRANDIRGNALVFFDWAEMCIWRLHPDCRVFLDGRFRSAYSVDTIDVYFRFIYGEPGWERALTEYPTDIVLVHRGNPASTNMRSLPGWQLVHESGLSLLFLKTEVHAEAIGRLTYDDASMPRDGDVAVFP